MKHLSKYLKKTINHSWAKNHSGRPERKRRRRTQWKIMAFIGPGRAGNRDLRLHRQNLLSLLENNK